jgi:pimeloyl-ACP methyl ester carboxylesterase
MHVDISGSGERGTALLLHSSGFSGRQWKKLAKLANEKGLRALVPDFAGQGESPALRLERRFTFRDDVAAVVELMQRQHDALHVVGHSYGGLIALQASAELKERVRSLAVYDPVAFGVLDPVRDADALAPLDVVTQRAGAIGDEEWLEVFVDFWGGPGAWRILREEARAEFRRTAGVVRDGVSTLALDRTPVARYAFSFPVLAMTGALSPISAQRVIERIVEALPQAKRVVVDGAGHFGPVTHADAVNAHVASSW